MKNHVKPHLVVAGTGTTMCYSPRAQYFGMFGNVQGLAQALGTYT